MTDEKRPDQPQERKAQPRKLTFEERTARLKADPRFRFVEGTGQAFIIGGQSPRHPKPQS
jgi:hypothetical protein